MVYVPASNTLKVEMRGTLNGKEIETTQYFKFPSFITGSTVDELFDYYETEFMPALLAEQSAALLIDELYATDLTTSSSPTYSRTFSPGRQGVLSSPAMPGNVPFCVSFRTDGRGRSARGRNYVPGICESQVTGNLLGLTTVSALVAAYELLLPSVPLPAGLIWSVVSTVLDGAPRATALVQDILDVLATDITVDSQRGRLH